MLLAQIWQLWLRASSMEPLDRRALTGTDWWYVTALVHKHLCVDGPPPQRLCVMALAVLYVYRACVMWLPILQLCIHVLLDFPAFCLQDMLVDIARKQDQTHLTAEHLEAGIKLVIDNLDQTYIDVPFAPKLVRPVAGITVPRILSSCAVHSCPFHGTFERLRYCIQLVPWGWFFWIAKVEINRR